MDSDLEAKTVEVVGNAGPFEVRKQVLMHMSLHGTYVPMYAPYTGLDEAHSSLRKQSWLTREAQKLLVLGGNVLGQFHVDAAYDR